MSIISIGSACKVRESIDRFYGTDRETNLFDWVISNFNTILYFVKNIDKNIQAEHFLDTGKTILNNRIVFHKETRYISIHDFPVSSSYIQILPKFIDTLNRRLKRFKNTIVNSSQLDFIHVLDMDTNYDFKENPIFPPSKLFLPSEKNICELIDHIKIINPSLNFTLHILVPPDYLDDNIFFLNSYKKINHLSLHYLTKNDSINPEGFQCRHWSWEKVYQSLKNHGNVFISKNPDIIDDFNVENYKKLNKDLSNLSNEEALQHFKDFGRKEKRPYLIPKEFDYQIYIKCNKDLFNLNEHDALLHFINCGIKEKRIYKLPDDFNVKNYKKFNIDLSHFTDEQALEHFINNGIHEKRNYNFPNDFNLENYKNFYGDLHHLSQTEILEHYINIGIKENRIYKLPDDFDPDNYKKLNKDLSNFNNTQAQEHFIKHGIKEKRLYKLPHDFNVTNYKKLNKDISNFSDEKALEHFVIYGLKEKRKY